MNFTDFVYKMVGERMTTEEYLKTLTPEERTKREASLKRADEIEAEVREMDLPPRQHIREVNRRLREELPEEAQEWLQEFDEEVIRMIDERDKEAKLLKEEFKNRKEQLDEWRNAGEAPNVGLLFESYAREAPFEAFFDCAGIFIQRRVRNSLLKFQKTGYLPFMLSSLDKLRKLAFLSAIGGKYAAGEISSPLLEVLQVTPQFPQIKNAEDFRNADPAEYVSVAASKGEIDISSYSKLEQGWIRTAPFYSMGYFGNLDSILPFVENQKNILRGQIAGVMAAAFDSKYNPLAESDLKEFITLLNDIVMDDNYLKQGNRTLLFPTAYFNVVQRKLYDMRPYAAELRQLFTIPDFSFIGELADILTTQIDEHRKRQLQEANSGNEILQSLFPEVYYCPPETAKDFRNFPISKPEKYLIRSYANARINGGTIQLTDGDGNVLQELKFTDLNGQVSQEIIRPFDISIMNCIGSLQQKYNRSAFTDIEIAREFNSTQDKKGNITPASPIVLEVRESMRRLSVTYGSLDITQQIEQELKRRNPDMDKINRLRKGASIFGLQHLVNVKKVVIHTMKNDKDTLLYFIDGSPLFYLHAAITHQIVQVPFAQMNSKKNLTTEIRLLREQTRIALETKISMLKRKVGSNVIRFNPIIDSTFRTSADAPEDPTKVETTELVERIPERKRYRLQEQIRNYLDELIAHGYIAEYTVLKKKIPGKRKQVDYGFSFVLPEDKQKKPANKK